MARHEERREDLLREATALQRRVEFRVPGCQAPFVIGFRGNGAASVFCGEDPVYQFTTHNEIRRGFFQGDLLKSKAGQLYRLRRERTDKQTRLMRSKLPDESLHQYMALLHQHRDTIIATIAANEVEIVGQIPTGHNVLGDVADWLQTLKFPVPIAHTPQLQ